MPVRHTFLGRSTDITRDPILDGKSSIFSNTSRTGGGSNSTAYEFSATGGTILTPGDGFTYHRFTSPGTFSVVNSTNLTLDYVVVGQGGNGRPGASNQGGGGGGGGGVRHGTTSFGTDDYEITAGPSHNIIKDSSSNVLHYATAGGPGGTAGGGSGSSGGSGGGGGGTSGGSTVASPDGVDPTAQGNNGGPGNSGRGGGGGGAGGASPGYTPNPAGIGGPALVLPNFTAIAPAGFAGGGGGGGVNPNTPAPSGGGNYGVGGNGGGSNAAQPQPGATSGTNGVVIFRYPINYPLGI